MFTLFSYPLNPFLWVEMCCFFFHEECAGFQLNQYVALKEICQVVLPEAPLLTENTVTYWFFYTSCNLVNS